MVIIFCIGLKVFVHNRAFPCGPVTLFLSEVTVGVIQMRGNWCLCGCRTRSCQYIVSLQVKCSNKIVTFVLLDMLVMDKAFFRKIQIDTRMSLDWKVRYQESCPPLYHLLTITHRFSAVHNVHSVVFPPEIFLGGGGGTFKGKRDSASGDYDLRCPLNKAWISVQTDKRGQNRFGKFLKNFMCFQYI